MLRAARTLAGGSLLGKLLGVARELLLAALFGTTQLIDAYRAALTATLIPAHFFTGDSLNAGFIPLYTRTRLDDPAKAAALFRCLNLVLAAIGVAVAAALLAAAPVLVRLLVPGFDAETRAATAAFVRVMALGVPFYVQSALFAYLEMGNGSYTLASLRASVQSLGLIAGTIAAFRIGAPLFLAWGFTGAYVVFAGVGWILLRRSGLLAPPAPSPAPSPDAHWPARIVLGELWTIIRPLLLLPLILQGTIAVERIVASLLGIGTVAALEYARTITETGVLLLAVPLGLAGLAELSRVGGDAARERLGRLLPPLLLATVPLSAFLAVNAEGLVHILYARGAFGPESVALTQAILFGLAVGFWAQVVSYVLVKALNAEMRNREVVRIMGTALGLNMVFDLAAYRILGPIALGMGTSLYGVVLFGLAVRALGLEKALRSVAVPLTAGVALYAPLAWFARGPGFGRMAAAAALFAAYWGAFALAVPPVREIARAVWAKRREA